MLKKRIKDWKPTVFWGLLFLLAFAIPIERRHDKIFRFYSKTLIPEGLVLPQGFDYKIFFFPSDVAVLLFFLLGLSAWRLSWRASLRDRNLLFFGGMFGGAFFSIFYSGYSAYPLLYIRLWQLGTAGLLFAALITIPLQWKDKALKVIASALLAAAFLQSIFAIAQYFCQGSIGLHSLGEPRFSPSDPSSAAIQVTGGARWLFDSWFQMASSLSKNVVRSMGTMNHPNVLAGFLVMSSLLVFPFYEKSKVKWLWGSFLFLQLFALVTTFSRAGVLGFGVGALVWFGWHWHKRIQTSLLPSLLSIVFVLGFLFQEQWSSRGASQNSISSASNQTRLELQATAWNFIQNSPLHGVGYNLYSVHSGTLPVHNIYLLWAAETGLLSGLCFLLFLGRIGWRALQAPPSPFLPTLLGIFVAFLLIGGCDLYFLISQQGRLFFFLIAALVALMPDQKQDQRKIALMPHAMKK
jgi:O-antigen ligase